MQKLIAPSILSADLAQLEAECKKLQAAKADWMHLDVMDGHFVPNLTFGPPMVKCLSKHLERAFLDVHMMVSNPSLWIKPMAEGGAHQITFHIEAVADCNAAIELAEQCAKYGAKAGLAIKPKTPLSAVDDALKTGKFHTLLVMTVEPGFGGQAFMHNCLDKVKEARDHYPSLNIQVDGGINSDTAKAASEAGANVFVAGTYIVSCDDQAQRIADLRKAIKSG